ncbi:hypothetical protein M011DRAFT_259953 [Sporormia fimetaria CBS 119925]|uniref:Exonuclease V n=1 Tax=Sporormia fimetaria CBS 119925 TaxID=1340428 RepID=A0A6A6UX43_9PLEO|nr:hypothetical protein M011DRAFT_259953 [Sporormia fimetaria CBS 119925]
MTMVWTPRCPSMLAQPCFTVSELSLLPQRTPLLPQTYTSISRCAASRTRITALSRNRLSKESSSAPTTHEQPLSPPDLDTRSPLERFRTKPKKPLSVTDLVSPAWCELQYSFVLTRFGRKPRTQAMKQGSKVHKVLEEQVHTFVPVQTASKEDRFGLRIWNVIQGLRTLRETGMTRELEIWGVLEGQLVCGVIDEVSYKCPDTRFEEELVKTAAEKTGEMASQSQRNIANYFAPVDTAAVPGTQATRPVYIADVKTRGVKSLPSGASLRPTKMQLMLYKKMLQSLAQNDVDADVVFARYSLNPLQPFTITEVAGMDSSQADETDFPSETPGFVADMETHTNLSALWSLMISEFAETFTGVSDVLRAEFRHSKDGDVIGSELFVYEKGTIEEYIAREMGWWKGERPAVGVEVEEAFKCRSCDFADECEWRKSKIQEATENHRRRVAGRGKVEVVG